MLAAAAVTATGCGSKDRAVELADVQPCLSKLALVVVPKLPPGMHFDPSSQRAEFASVSFGPGNTGATAANISFFRSSKAVDTNFAALRKARAAGIRVGGTTPRRFGKTILISWSSPPSPRQVRAVTACLRGGG